MLEVIKLSPGKTKLIMENSAGGGSKIGLTTDEIGAIYNLAKKMDAKTTKNRIKICIDTAHAFGAGILEKFSKSELEKFKKDAEKSFGLENIIVLHINDSKVPFDSKKDRHENLGEGHIGIKAFESLAKDEYFSKIPWLLEVPGFEKKGPDKKNIDIAKSLFK